MTPSPINQSGNRTMIPHALALPDPPRTPVRLGVVGLGFIFRECHGPALRILQACGWPVELVAVCDANPAPLAQTIAAWPGARPYTDGAALLAGERLDGVLVLTWPPHSAEFARQAIGRVPGMFIEKPVAFDVAGIERLLEQAGAVTGTRVQVGYNRRHMPAAVAFRQALQRPDASRRVAVRFLRANRSEPIFYEETLGHPLDFLRSCFRDVQIATVAAEPPRPGQSLPAAVRVTGFCDEYPLVLESRPSAGCHLEEYTVCGDTTNLCLNHPGGAVAPGEQAATLAAQGMIQQLATFVRLVSGVETTSTCSLADALAAWRLIETVLRRIQRDTWEKCPPALRPQPGG